MYFSQGRDLNSYHCVVLMECTMCIGSYTANYTPLKLFVCKMCIAKWIWGGMQTQMYKGDPRTCPILIPAWGSNLGEFYRKKLEETVSSGRKKLWKKHVVFPLWKKLMNLIVILISSFKLHYIQEGFSKTRQNRKHEILQSRTHPLN